jgi:hypothetical protein
MFPFKFAESFPESAPTRLRCRFSEGEYNQISLHQCLIRVRGCQICFNPAKKKSNLSDIPKRRSTDDEIHALRVLKELQNEKELWTLFLEGGGGHGRFIPERVPLQRHVRAAVRSNRQQVFRKCLQLVDSVLQM